MKALQRGLQRAGVTRRNDEPGLLVLYQAARGGSYGIGGDHGNSLVEGFVDDEAPRLQEVPGGDRRHHYNVAARVEVPQIRGRPLVGEHERARFVGLAEDVDALLVRGAAGEEDLEVAAAVGLWGGCAPE